MGNSLQINRVAVLGTGVMGAQIAAHFSNVKIPVYAFDISQEIAEKGVSSSTKIKPSAYYNPKSVELITPCNYDDHLEKINECDWVIEVIAERLDWKQDLYQKIAPHLKDNAIITSNTSGIALSELSQGLPDDFANRFFITHFFNPPRYMKLVEIISSEKTNTELIPPVANFLEEVLGKGVVYAKDTPNFIANRIGVFGMMVTLQEAYKRKLSVEDVDALTGTLIGRPKSATFRTADVVGLDTLSFVAGTAYEKCLEDSNRDIFKIPDYLQTMLDNKWLGQKTKQGFYKKIDKGVIHSLDLQTLEYTPMNKKRYKGIRFARENTYPKDRLKALLNTNDVAGEFTWEVISQSLLYSAERVGEIADDIVNIDRAMRWGFAWEMGPFEVWDSLGVSETVDRMKASSRKIPNWITEMLTAGVDSFYTYKDGALHFYDIASKGYVKVSQNAKTYNMNIAKHSHSTIKKLWSASVVDLGDNVAGIDLHSVLKAELNPIDGSIMETIKYGLDYVKENNFKGLVISGDGANFCAGANLNLVLGAAERKDFDAIEKISGGFQDLMQEVRFAPFPVVAAPFGLVLGGGFEIAGACDKIVAAAESYIGLVEVGVGLIPGAGGNLRMLSNLSKKIKTAMPGAFPVVQKAFETIGFAKVATSAKQAQAYSYLTKEDVIVVNRDHLLFEAKNAVLEMAETYETPELETFKLPGVSGRLVLEGSIKGFEKAKKISEHDAFIGKKLAYVLTGGDKGGPFSPVDEQYLLDIEREVFVSLCGEPKSQARIAYMLKKGKPLRN